MTREILRDKTLDGLERFFDGSGFKWGCWALIILAVMYFGPVYIRILAR
mgnify:FL=1